MNENLISLELCNSKQLYDCVQELLAERKSLRNARLEERTAHGKRISWNGVGSFTVMPSNFNSS